MKQQLLGLLILIFFFTLQATGQNELPNGTWKVISTDAKSGEIVLKMTDNLNPKQIGFMLNPDQSAFRVMYIARCGFGKRRPPKTLKATWKLLTSKTFEIRTENPYEETTILEKFEIDNSSSKKVRIIRTHFEVIENEI